MLRLIVGLLVLLGGFSQALGQTVWYEGSGRRGDRSGWYSGRVCSNPNCDMCGKIEVAQAAARASAARPIGRAVSVPAKSEPEYDLVTETRYRTEVRQQCVNGVCTFISVEVPYQVTVRVPKAKPAANPRLTDQELVPTPMPAVLAMLNIAKPQPGEKVTDLGCGDGRVPVLAAREYGVEALGIDLNADSLKLARSLADLEGVSDRVEFRQGDIRQADIPFGIVTMYLWPELMAAVWPRIPVGCFVISRSHELPVDYGQRVDVGDEVFFICVKRFTDDDS